DGGTLKLASAGALPAGTNVITSNTPGAVLDLNGISRTVASLGGGGTSGGDIQLNGATLTLSVPAGTMQFGGAIKGSGGGVMVNFTNSGALGMTGSPSARTLTLTGLSVGTFASLSRLESSLAAVIPDSGAGSATSLSKTGTVQWDLTGASTYTGVTSIAGGTL